MKLIVGLGNPGREYEDTRHNAGFKAIDILAQHLNVDVSQKGFKGLYGTKNIFGEKVFILKPQTYMNLSGESVRAVMDYYKIHISDLIVIYDDIDLPIGKIRIKEKGSAGGQNGMKDIIKHMGTQQFLRVRVGIGNDSRIELKNYVLGKFTKDEIVGFNESLVDAVNAIDEIIKGKDILKVMSTYN